MKFAFIAQEVAFPVETMCRVLGVARSGFYAWKKRPKPARAKSDAQLAVQVAAAHQRSRRTYGSPRVHRELRAQGVRVSKKRVERLMRENGIQGRAKRRFKRTTDSKHGGPIAPNILGRRFTVTEPNRVWVTDVTAIATGEGWLYLAPVLDLFSRRVVGWASSESNDTALALDALG
jgi:transposase InsO family protein